ncbi:helix-turn-helix domain-containing protein [Streptosporangium carneum]|uniref:Transcriptional regulator n=1 Tax=Streptosporangium carneum TaxID=47481 RepID=A0A9W6HX92_9ACTN|nr:helix-turn-helix domain-containing protein [Streptosporangium carneum]GLK07070.1 transcriptional regulator [Streptosporangium carneum]
MLSAAGLSAEEEAAYRLLVRTAGVEPAELAEELGVESEAARRTLGSLLAKGLARAVPGESDRFTAVAPDVALAARLHRRQEEVDRARQAVEQLTGEYLVHARRREAAQLIEVITSRTALREQLRLLQDNARHEVVSLCRAGHVAMTSQENTEELAALRRGVGYRVLYESVLLEEPGMLVNLAEGIRLGERARALPTLPVRMIIADGELGVLPLIQHTGGLTQLTAALIRPSSLLDALGALFESLWERATPVSLTRSESPLDSDHLYLLSLLVAGVSDKSIATQLKVSQRTVQRRITHLMEQAGAQTRMQLAWHAARENWL